MNLKNEYWRELMRVELILTNLSLTYRKTIGEIFYDLRQIHSFKKTRPTDIQLSLQDYDFLRRVRK